MYNEMQTQVRISEIICNWRRFIFWYSHYLVYPDIKKIKKKSLLTGKWNLQDLEIAGRVILKEIKEIKYAGVD